MKKLIALLFVAAFVGWAWWAASAYDINGQKPGSTTAMTPIAVGTATPVKILSCAATRGVSHTTGLSIYNDTGGKCWIAPAPASSPCAAATPAPNASTPAGWLLPSGQSQFPWSIYGYTNILDSEWDAVCATAGNIYENAVP